MIRPIYLYGAEVLRKKAAEVNLEDREAIAALVQDLKDTLVVADYLKGFRRTLINPEILQESEEQTTYSEGCLSIPGIYCDIVRPKSITVRYYDENLEQHTETFDNFASRMIQHELSHLEGDLFTDHAAPIRKKMLSSKLQNISKGKVHPHYNSKLR